jgi:serine acetyltransferase
MNQIHIGNHVTIAPNSVVVDIEDNTVKGEIPCGNLK